MMPTVSQILVFLVLLGTVTGTVELGTLIWRRFFRDE
jgi:hypothetical protein